MSKLSDILIIIKKRLFWVPLDEDGEVKYVVVNVTKENIVDMTKNFMNSCIRKVNMEIM